MAGKFVVLAFTVAVCHAAPFVITSNNYVPGSLYRSSGTPSIAHGFGSGFSSNIGGIQQSFGIGHSYQSGDGEAYGGGFANSEGSPYASGVGIANTNSKPTYQIYNAQPVSGWQSPYNNALNRNYGSAVSSAQNFGNFGSAIAQSNTAGYGSAVSSASNLRGLGYGSAVSSATSNNGYGSAISTANNSGYGTAVSSAQTRDGLGDYSSAVSASENVGGIRANTAHTVQQSGGAVQHSGATSYEGPGIQASHSHAVNTGYY